MTISKKAIKEIQTNVKVRAALMVKFNMTERSVFNWIERNDVRLTTVSAINAIKENSALKESEIISA